MKQTPIVIAFTPNYFVPAATTLKSLLDSSQGAFTAICLLSEEIPTEMKDELEKMGAGRLEFRYLNLGGQLKDIYIDPRYSEAASFRMLLPELLPEYEKVVYLDCDIIVRQDVAALYETCDPGDNLLAAVYEAPIENQRERWRALGCAPEAYFNSGFLLMNLKQMRREGTTDKLMEASRVDYLEFPDQDALNIVCKGRIKQLRPIWNGIRTFFLPQYKTDFIRQYGSEELWEEVQGKAIIHYTGGKPWNVFTVKFAEWWKTFDSLPGEIRSHFNGSKKMRLLWKIYKTQIGRKGIDGVQKLYRRLKK